MEFYVYENWTHHKAMLHRGDCGYCNHGAGVHGGGKTRNGQWHAPFKTLDEAVDQARLTGEVQMSCSSCSPG